MSTVLDGKKLSDILAIRLKGKIKRMSRKPKLVIIQVGNLKESNTYIKNKIAFAKRIGAIALHKKYPKSIKEGHLISQIKKFNLDNEIDGIIVQLPISKSLDTDNVIESIKPEKDVDGLTSRNTKLLMDNNEIFVPATTKGIITLLHYYKIDFVGKRVVIVGQSSLVGKPTALAFLNRKATVVVCNTHTKKLDRETKEADILIVAVGHKNLITSKYVKEGQIIVDVGINIGKDKKITGDVNYKSVAGKVKAITPVPGGVGPMTIASLFDNLVSSYSKSYL